MHLINEASRYSLPGDMTAADHIRQAARVLGRLAGYLAMVAMGAAFWAVMLYCAFAGVLAP